MVTNTATLVFLSDNCNAVKDAQGRNIELLCNCSFLGRDILFVEEYDALRISQYESFWCWSSQTKASYSLANNPTNIGN